MSRDSRRRRMKADMERFVGMMAIPLTVDFNGAVVSYWIPLKTNNPAEGWEIGPVAFDSKAYTWKSVF